MPIITGIESPPAVFSFSATVRLLTIVENVAE